MGWMAPFRGIECWVVGPPHRGGKNSPESMLIFIGDVSFSPNATYYCAATK
jgi:hypothetical protein